MRCEEIQEMLPSYVRGDATLTVRRHLSACPDCQTELSRYEELAGSLGSLRGVHAEPPAGLLPALYAIPSASSRVDTVKSHVSRNKKAYAGVAVAVAGAAGAALLRNRSRRIATA